MKGSLLLLLVAACGRVGFDGVDGVDAGDAAAPVDTTVPFDPLACPASYTLTTASTTSRYRHVLTTQFWEQAALECENDDTVTGDGTYTHLAVFSTLAEQLDLGQSVVEVWAGYSDRNTEGTFLSVTNEPLGPQLAPGGPGWYSSEPNDQDGIEDCLHLKGEDTFNDADCATAKPAMCECDGTPNDPTRY